MRSTSATRSPGALRRRAALGLAAVVAASVVVGGSRALADEKPAPPTAVVGWIDSKDPAIARDLFDGATLAIEAAEKAGEAHLVVRRGTSEGAWGTVAASAVRLVAEEEAVVLVTPPEREAAHLLAQVGTKMRVPIVSTSRAPMTR